MSLLPLRDQLVAGVALALGAAAAFGARAALIELYLILSSSMAPTLCAGDRVIALKRPRRLAKERGAVVAFRDPTSTVERDLLDQTGRCGGWGPRRDQRWQAEGEWHNRCTGLCCLQLQTAHRPGREPFRAR